MYLPLKFPTSILIKILEEFRCHLIFINFSYTLILFYKQRFISNTKYEKTSWTTE